MFVWLLKRIVQAMLVMLAMTVIVFIGINVIGSPVDILVPPDADQAERLRLIRYLGLDQPLWRQYLDFLKGAIQGNLGVSYVYNRPAMEVIVQRLPATLELAVSATVISVLLGVPLGLLAGLKPNSVVSKLLMTGSILGFSLPTFWIGIMFIMVFSVQLGWLPSSGRGETVTIFGVPWSIITAGGLTHLIMPALNLAMFKVALVMRLVRAGVQEVLPQDYIRYARARGISESRIIWVHVLKNIMIPVVTVIGLEFGSVIAFSVVTESIFAWPGMGKLIIDSINVLDRPIIVAYLMMIVLVFVCINLIVDVVYTLLDPRVRLATKGSV